MVIDLQGGVTALMLACDAGNSKIVQRLLNTPDIDINKRDDVRLCLTQILIFLSDDKSLLDQK